MKKVSYILCLSFLPKISTEPLHIPFEVRRIIKSRIESQYERQYPLRDIRFDDDSCEHRGSYEFKAGALALNASHEFWQGTQDFDLNSILDGAKLVFPTYENVENLPQNSDTPSFHLEKEYKKEEKLGSTWLWIGGVVATSLVASFLVRSSSKGEKNSASISTSVPHNSSSPTPQRPALDPGRARN